MRVLSPGFGHRERATPMNIEALLLSIRLALCVSAILFVIGVPLGYWLAYSQWRWKFLLEAGLWVFPPPPPPGLWVFVFFAPGAPRPPVGIWVAGLCGRSA